MAVKQSMLRDLIREVYWVASTHPAYSQAHDVINNALDHLAARARNEEVNQLRGVQENPTEIQQNSR